MMDSQPGSAVDVDVLLQVIGQLDRIEDIDRVVKAAEERRREIAN